jgi:hypothetical protein
MQFLKVTFDWLIESANAKPVDTEGGLSYSFYFCRCLKFFKINNEREREDKVE